MSDTLTNGPSPEATELQPEHTSEDTVRQMVAAHESEEVPAPLVDKAEPTTVDLEAQLAQPAVENEERNTTPPETNRVTNANILNLRDTNKTAAPSERLNNLYAAAEKGDLVHTAGQTPEASSIVDHPVPTENSAGEPVVEVKPEKKSKWYNPTTWGK